MPENKYSGTIPKRMMTSNLASLSWVAAKADKGAAKAMLVAPATANTVGKLAQGIADDALSTLYTATRAPTVVAPAMNSNMFEHPAVQENLGKPAVLAVSPGGVVQLEADGPQWDAVFGEDSATQADAEAEVTE